MIKINFDGGGGCLWIAAMAVLSPLLSVIFLALLAGWTFGVMIWLAKWNFILFSNETIAALLHLCECGG